MSHEPIFTPRPIAFVRSPHVQPSDVPRGPGTKHEAVGRIEVLPEFEEGLLDIEGFSHLFVIWVFHESDGYLLTGSPPGEDRPHGVFATRSPYRPNPLGLTVVKLIGREGRILHVHGVDMIDGTPVLDIKPYMSSIPEDQLRRGWFDESARRRGAS